MDENGFKKTRIQEKEKRGGIHQPIYGTWVANFMLRQDAGMMIAFITCNSSLVPLLEGLVAQI